MKRDGGLIVALDVETPRAARALVRRVGREADFYKVPPSLVLKDPSLLRWLARRRKKVFLDCKWYDIPSQVARSVREAARQGVASCTVHAGAGSAVLRAAAAVRPRPLLWAVTVLTSLDRAGLRECGVSATPERQVLRLARLAARAGVDGLVCSPREARALRRRGVRLPLVTPGIAWGRAAADQRRTASPAEAWSAGADWIVVGRAVAGARDPAAVVRDILKEKPC
jgi:orotidine-5'-phosphate decarboxylase